MIMGVPYDAEIEYLESTGTQYIDTGIDCSSLNFEIDAYVNASNSFWGWVHQNYGQGTWITQSVSALYYGNFNRKNTSAKLIIGELHRYVFNSAGSALIDNLQVASFSLLIGTDSIAGHPLIIFAAYDFEAKAIEPHASKIYALTVKNGGVLVRDLIPVRVGQVGYMYDRVSKKLFGNQGTGNFVLGPDVAKPVMGIWRYRDNYFASDYIHNGLVAMWDGIENAGRGVHDSALNGWKDISGNNHTITNRTTSGTHPMWSDNALVLSTGNKFAYGNNDAIFSGKTAATFEYIFDLTQTTYFIQIGAFRQSSENIRICINRQTTELERGVIVPMVANLTDGSKVGTQVIPHSSWQYLYSNTYSAVITIDENGLVKFYVHGRLYCQFQLTVSFSATYASRSGLGVFAEYYNLNSLWNREGTAKVYAIRLYGRALTADEIAHNYNIDKVRFNLP